MLSLFDESYDLVRRGGSTVNHHVRWIDGYHFELVIRQGILKFFKFSYTTRSFRDVSQSVKFLSFAFLNGITLFEVAVIWVT